MAPGKFAISKSRFIKKKKKKKKDTAELYMEYPETSFYAIII